MKVLNYDIVDVRKQKSTDNLLNFPRDIRCIICGPAACGKTNLVINFICNPGWLNYDKLHVYSKSLFQDKYVHLRKAFEEVCPDVATFCSNNDEIPPPEELGPGKTVILLDDFMIEKQDKIERYFAYGRHADATIFYLCQTYSRIPKRVIRDNANVIILFRQDEKNLRHVFSNHVSGDMSFEEFRTKCGEYWNSDPYGFLLIDKTKPLDQRYRRMLDKR